jgi:hypothetical protein
MVDRLLEPEPLQSRRILQTRVDATSYRHATDQVLDWAAAVESRYVAPVSAAARPGCTWPSC